MVARMLGLEAVVPRCHDQNSKVARDLTPPCAMSPGTQTLAPHGDAATIVAARKIEPDRKQAMPRASAPPRTPLERRTDSREQ